MDIFAHALWTNILARGIKKRQEKNHARLIKLGWATFWGIFPDLFAFTIPFVAGIVLWISGNGFEYGRDSIASGIAPILYNYSHSLIIWLAIFIIVWIIAKRPRWELIGWALHILIDIPSHGGGFYLTPFLWPISDFKFTHGVSWAHPVYMIVNYSVLLAVWGGIVAYKMYQKRKTKP